jgi:hypothetical protein
VTTENLKPTELIAARERIRAAEKKQVPLVRESVGLDAEALNMLADLVERGLGKKLDVLRQALATGLRVLKVGSDPAPEQPSDLRVTPENDAFAFARGVAGGSGGMGEPITVPPSQQRRDEGYEIPDEDDDA